MSDIFRGVMACKSEPPSPCYLDMETEMDQDSCSTGISPVSPRSTTMGIQPMSPNSSTKYLMVHSSDMVHSPSSHPYKSHRGSKKPCSKPAFNRSTVKIEDCIRKDAAELNAKTMRVLLPAMFQKFRHPDKETGKTKVKGLWEPGNKPDDFPHDVDFKDPNNSSKMSNDMMKKFFNYLKKKLLEMPEYQRNYRTPKTSRYSVDSIPEVPAAHLSAANNQTQPLYRIPKLEEFGGQSPPGRTQHYSADEQTQINQNGGKHWPQNNMGITERFFTSVSIIPSTVEHVKTEDENAAAVLANLGCNTVAANEECPDKQFLQYEVADSTCAQPELNYSEPDVAYQQTDLAYPQAPSAVHVPYQSYTSQDVDGNMVTDLTLLHQVPAAEMPSTHQIITLGEDDSSRQPVHPQEVPTTNTCPDSTQEYECAKFVDEIREGLKPALHEFGDTFESNSSVIEMVNSLLDEVLKPKFAVASQGDKAECQQVSKFCSKFQEILKRYCFLGKGNDPLNELENLKREYVASNLLVIPECQVPDVDHEVQVYKAEVADVKPVMTSTQGPWIPTIADIEARADQKRRQLEYPEGQEEDFAINCATYSQEKVRVEKMPYNESLLSPMCADMNNMNIDVDLTEEELGISIVEHPDQDANEDLQRAIEEEMRRKEAKESQKRTRQYQTNVQPIYTEPLNQSSPAPVHVSPPSNGAQYEAMACDEDLALTNLLNEACKHFGGPPMAADGPLMIDGSLDLSESDFSLLLKDVTQHDENNYIDESMLVEADLGMDTGLGVGVQPEAYKFYDHQMQPNMNVPLTKAVQPTEDIQPVQSLPTVLDHFKGTQPVSGNIPTTVFDAANRSDDEEPKPKRRMSSKGKGKCYGRTYSKNQK